MSCGIVFGSLGDVENDASLQPAPTSTLQTISIYYELDNVVFNYRPLMIALAARTMCLPIMLMCMWCLTSCAVTRDGVEHSSQRITKLSFRYQGEKTVEEERLKAFMSIRSGGVYSPKKLDDDLRSLYESGLVDDMKFYYERDGDGIHVIVEVTTPPRQRSVPFVGNTAFSDRALAVVTLKEKTKPIDMETVKAMRGRLVRHYKSYGYNDVKISVKSFRGGSPKPDDFMFMIAEGERLKKRVKISSSK